MRDVHGRGSRLSVGLRHDTPMHIEDISVTDLLLDVDNPRHEPMKSQREAITALLADDGREKLISLATDIAAQGLSPIDLLMVMPGGTNRSSHIVLEGNRRTAVLKLQAVPTVVRSGLVSRVSSSSLL